MIPKFPKFKKIELTDEKDVRVITSQFEPYSDFDFTCMWSWDIDGKYRISNLNGNLILRLTEHFTDEVFYTFIGNSEVNKTLKQLFAFSELIEDDNPRLKLIPESVLKDVDLNKYIIEIDLDNYDYVYDLREHINYEGSKYSQKRKMANRFLRNYPDHQIELLDVTQKETKEHILDLCSHWKDTKLKSVDGFDFEKEELAIQRFLNANFNDVMCLGAKVGNRLIGFEIFTLLSNKYAISHFAKTDISYVGLYEYMVSQSASILVKKGIIYLNAEEDLGIPQLRFSKNSYRPVKLLRKYALTEL